MIRVQSDPFEASEELRAFQARHQDAGAVSSFTGYVRAEDGQVSALILQHYPGFTESQIEQINEDALNRFDVQDTLIIHRWGRMEPGEPIVLVAAAAAHRKPALQAVDFLMDYLKTDAPFWKKEDTPKGSAWIEPRKQDYASRNDW